MCCKHSIDVVQPPVKSIFCPFLARHELLTFTLIHAACSKCISNLTITEVLQHATSVFPTFVKYITKKKPYFLD